MKKIVCLTMLGISTTFLTAMENQITPLSSNTHKLPPPPYILQREDATAELPVLQQYPSIPAPTSLHPIGYGKPQALTPKKTCCSAIRMAYHNLFKKRNVNNAA